MFKVTRKGPARLDIELGGKLDSDAMKAALDELVREAEDIEHGTMLYRVRDFELPTAGALGVELARLPKLLALMRRFDRAAVLANERWVRKLSELEGKFVPGLEIKGFEPDAVVEAEAWLEA